METININPGNNINKSDYTLTKDISYEGTVLLLIQNLHDHHEGIRELIKNSGSALIRENKMDEGKEVILFLKNKTKNSPSLIGLLDFVGMTRKRMITMKKLNDQNAAIDSTVKKEDVWGGHGNGGKIYAIKLFDSGMWHSCFNNKFNEGGYVSRYVTTKDIKNNSWWMKNEENVTNPIKNKLEKFLKQFNVKFSDLPKAAQAKLKKNNGNFTFFIGKNPEGFQKNIKRSELLEALLRDTESLEPLEKLDLHVYSEGEHIKEKINNIYEHKPEVIKPHKDFIEPKKIPIPDELYDRTTKEMVSFKNSKEKYLLIKSCELDMSNSRFKDRFKFRGKSSEGIQKYYGYIHPRNCTSQYSAFPKHLYGEFFYDELWKYASVTRQEFSDSKEIRAIQSFIGEHLDKIAQEHDKSAQDAMEKKAQEEINKFNKNLEDLFSKNNFIKNFYKGGVSGKGTGGEGGRKKPKSEKSNKVEQIVLNLTYDYCGLGVTFRPNIKSYNKKGLENQVKENEVNNPAIKFEISDENIIEEHEKSLNLLFSKNPGTVKIKVTSKDLKTKISSNTVQLNVIQISKISLSKKLLKLPEGSKLNLMPKIIDNTGKQINGCYLLCIADDNDIVATSSIGQIYGLNLGETKIKCMTNDCESDDLKIDVIKSDKKKGKGGGFPKVLISGIDADPLIEGSDKPFYLKEKNPKIYQRLQDVEKGIWWINLQTAIASKIYKRKGLSKNYQAGEKSKEFKMYMLMNWLEILARVNIKNNETPPASVAEYLAFIDNQLVDFDQLMKPHMEKILSIDFTKRDEN